MNKVQRERNLSICFSALQEGVTQGSWLMTRDVAGEYESMNRHKLKMNMSKVIT